MRFLVSKFNKPKSQEEKKMATLVSKTKFSNHSRSISLPTSSHPLVSNAEHQLRRLKSSDCASWSSTPQKFDVLRNLYQYLDDVLRLTQSQQFLSKERNGAWKDEILDGSLMLLDICNTAKDAYLVIKVSIQELESSLRRKRGLDLDNEVEAYMVSKKKLNRVICKCFKEMKKAEKNCSMASVPLVNQIKEAQEISLSLLQSSISFISEPQTKGWSLVSKLLQQNKGETEISEIRSIEVELLLLNSKKSNKNIDLIRTQNLVKRLEAFGSSIEEMVEVLEDIFRLLLKARVSLLNIVNH